MQNPFERFLKFLETVPDPRRAEGKRYELKYVLLFAILAVATGANSYRGVRTFIEVHRRQLNKLFDLKWQQAPAHTSIRAILSGLDAEKLERTFRRHARALNEVHSSTGVARVLALDGKAMKGSFDSFRDRKAGQVLSAFAADAALVLAHIEIDEKSNEIPAVQKLLEDLDVGDHLVTCDAMHCQKKPLKRPRRNART
jgi:DDE_Tnp_1-associated